MSEIDKIIKKIKGKLPIFKDKYDIEELGIFGSYIRNEQSEKSDLDVLVLFNKPNRMTLFKYSALERELSDLLEKQVDLVDKAVLKPNIGKSILKEVIYLT